jgi:superfamily II DNA/RNA helicase
MINLGSRLAKSLLLARAVARRTPPLTSPARFGFSTSPASPPSISFESLGLSPALAARLRAQGIERPSAAQAAALPGLLAARRHCVVRAETGGGKTLCYLLPALEALERRAAALSEGNQLFPVALVVVPSAELVAQVVASARALLPEGLRALVRGCHGTAGVTRRMNCGLVVATPRAVREVVHPAHRTAELLFVVLDECDALLAGALREDTVQAVLAEYKMVPPAERPLHVFCAATLPPRGKDGAAAFLDRYYPPGECDRVETAGAHRAVAHVRQRFVQIDAALPLTKFEAAQRERLRAKVARMASEAAAATEAAAAAAAAAAATAANATATSTAGDVLGVGSAKALDAAAGEVGFGTEGTEAAEPGEPGEVDADFPPEDGGGSDAIARATGARVREDQFLAMRDDEARHLAKVEALRREAVIEALLAPARLLLSLGDGAAPAGLLEEPRGGDAPGEAEAALAAQVAEVREGGGEDEEGAGGSGEFGLLVAQPPPAHRRERVRGALRQAKEAARTLITADLFSSALLAAAAQGGAATGGVGVNVGVGVGVGVGSTASTAGAAALQPPPPELVPLALPEGSRARLSRAQCEAVPATLVFVNSAAAADMLRRHLAARLPFLRVSDVHSDVPESARRARLADFAAGRVRVLVATNLAARGLDTAHVAHVVQAEFAGDAVAHLHRVGRTARAGRAGLATALVVRGQVDLVRALIGAEAAGEGIDAAFSHRRSFARRAKRAALSSAEDVVVMGVLEGEQRALRAASEDSATA